MDWGIKMLKMKLTKTHLSHSTLNAGGFEKAFGEALGISFDDIPQGGENGLELDCLLELGATAKKTTLKLYRPKSKPEKRLWIKGLKESAKAGDYLVFFLHSGEEHPPESGQYYPIVACIQTPD